MEELGDTLDSELVEGCSSCIKNRGTAYALRKLKEYVIETSDNGKKDCYFLKIDLSGYFMSINREIVCNKFLDLINQKYMGKHKELLLYLTPIIFLNNPSENCTYKCSEYLRERVPERRKMKKNSEIGFLKRYNCRKLICNYAKIILEKTRGIVDFSKDTLCFTKKIMDKC